MAENGEGAQGNGSQNGTGGEPDYKALYEQTKGELDAANAKVEQWKANSRKNEQRAKGNAGAAKDLEEANSQLADVTERLAAIEAENAKMKQDAEHATLVAEVAKETGVSQAIVASLAATDKETLTAAAKAISEAYQTPGGAPAASEAGNHVDLGQGTNNKAEQFAEFFKAQLA